MRLIRLNHVSAPRLAHTALALALMASIAMPTARAAVNKCTGADGKAVFSDRPCATGQATTQIKAATKPAAAITTPSKTILEADLPKEGTAAANSRLQAFDMVCAEARAVIANRANNNMKNWSESDFDSAKARAEKRCDPADRLTAAEQDRQNHTVHCNESRKSLKAMKQKPLPPGYSYGGDIAAMEAYIAKSCTSTLK